MPIILYTAAMQGNRPIFVQKKTSHNHSHIIQKPIRHSLIGKGVP